MPAFGWRRPWYSRRFENPARRTGNCRVAGVATCLLTGDPARRTGDPRWRSGELNPVDDAVTTGGQSRLAKPVAPGGCCSGRLETRSPHRYCAMLSPWRRRHRRSRRWRCRWRAVRARVQRPLCSPGCWLGIFSFVYGSLGRRGWEDERPRLPCVAGCDDRGGAGI